MAGGLQTAQLDDHSYRGYGKTMESPYEKNLSKPWDDTQLIPLGTPLMAYGL